jgi:hypothetical protein
MGVVLRVLVREGARDGERREEGGFIGVRRHGRREGACRLLSCCVQCSTSKPGCDGGCGCGASLLPVRMLMLMGPQSEC